MNAHIVRTLRAAGGVFVMIRAAFFFPKAVLWIGLLGENGSMVDP